MAPSFSTTGADDETGKTDQAERGGVEATVLTAVVQGPVGTGVLPSGGGQCEPVPPLAIVVEGFRRGHASPIPLRETAHGFGADADRYSFIAMDFHHLISAGLPASVIYFFWPAVLMSPVNH